MTEDIDKIYMARALQLARLGEGHVSPNPMVGCVIVSQNGEIIGEGWHRKYGFAHAEVNAMASVAEKDKPRLEGASMYVTLEPCSHYGKTPPCADMVAASSVSRVVVAMADPNPKVSGRGLDKLRAAGKRVVVGVMEEEARELNRRFLRAQGHDLPYITLKWACDAAGNMGFASPEERKSSKYSNALTRMRVHRLRAMHDAILVGARTASIDSPSLNVRFWSGANPRRVILQHGEQSLCELLKSLRNKGVTSILVEGGAAVLQSFIAEGLYDEIWRETNPTILPGTLAAPHIPAGIDYAEIVRGNILECSRVKKT